MVYGDRETSRVVPKDGTWNMRNLKFVDAKAIGKFGVLNITWVEEDHIQTFLKALGKATAEMGTDF